MPPDIDLRLKALELAAAAVTAGTVNHYDSVMLATEYLAFLHGLTPGMSDEEPEPAGVAVAARKH